MIRRDLQKVRIQYAAKYLYTIVIMVAVNLSVITVLQWRNGTDDTYLL